MRVALINTLGSESPIAHSPPLGLAYIAGMLESGGHSAIIIDRPVLKYRKELADVDKETEREILEFEPEIIGIGAMTIQVYDLAHTAKLVKQITKCNCPIVAGGFHPSAEPELTLKDYPEIDIVCRGEGEFTMLDFASGKKLSDIDGISFKENGKICQTKDRIPPKDLDVLPMPARHLLDMDFYSRRNDIVIACLPLRVATMATSRGCPFDCKFCSSKLIYKTRTYHSPEYVLNEIQLLMESYPVEAIRFVDCEMLPTRSRLEKICEGMIELGISEKLKWGCSMRANLVDKEILDLMKEAGCIFINYGFESGSQRMLDGMNKQVKVEDNHRAARLTSEAGILVNSDMIINLPDETEEDIKATIGFIEDNKKYLYSVGINHLMPLPGSPYYKEFLQKGILKHSDSLWGEIGILTKSVENISIYSQMARVKFVEMFHKLDRIASRNNIEKYIRLNWYRHPIFLLGRVFKSFRRVWSLFIGKRK